MITSLLIFLGIITLMIPTFNLAVVLLCYTIYWYEHANRYPDSIADRFSGKNLKLIITLVIREVFFNTITIMLIPFGLIHKNRPITQRGKTPVLLLHGLFVNQSCWFWFKRQLRKQGCTNIVTINLTGWHNEETLTELLAQRVDELRHQFGVNKVHLIGHSMGGVIARNYIQLRGGADKVDQLICLGSPHHGSKLAALSVTPLGKLLIPGSGFLRKLNSAPIPEQVQLTNIYTKKDDMVLPNSSHYLDWGNSIELDRMGHTALIYRKAPISATITALQNGNSDSKLH